MRIANWLGAVTSLALWLAACGRVDDSTADAGSAAQPAGAGASVGGGAGSGGEPSINLVGSDDAGGAAYYPPRFDARSCPTPVSLEFSGGIRCVTRAELADPNLPNVALDGGVSALGPADAWRCPQLNEITPFSGYCGGEHCCNLAACGPLTEHSASAGDASAAGEGGGSEQTCCYYVQEVCGV